jgi:hypothetical protein
MPKLRAIDFNKIKNGDEAEARRVIKDLLMLTPRGPNQKHRAHHYFKFECHPGKEAILKTHGEYIEAANEAEDGVVTSYSFRYHHNRRADWWGYTNEQLYWVSKTLGAKGTWLNESDYRSILRNHFCEEGYVRGAKLTRGSRRLANRMSAAWGLAIKGGKLGDLAFTCSIETPEIPGRERYYGPNVQASMDISFAGKNEDEARMMLQTMFGHAVASTTDIRFSAWQAAEPADILSKNMDQVARLQQARKKANSQLAQIQQFLSNLDTLEEAVQMYSMSICD